MPDLTTPTLEADGLEVVEQISQPRARALEREAQELRAQIERLRADNDRLRAAMRKVGALAAEVAAERPAAAEPVAAAGASGGGAPEGTPTVSFDDALRDPSTLVRALDTCGHVVVTGVCSREEAERHLDAIMREYSGAKLDPSGRVAAVPGAKGCSLLKRHGFAYMLAVQNCRTTVGKERVAAVYAALLGALGAPVDKQDLVMSCDAIALAVNGVTAMRMSRTDEDDTVAELKERMQGSSLGLHVDVGVDTAGRKYEQALEASGYYPRNVQGCLNLMDTTESSPGFVCLSMDRATTAQLRADIPRSCKKDMFNLTPELLRKYDALGRFRSVCAGAGSLTLWCSDLPHSNRRGDPGAYRSHDLDPNGPSRCGVMMCLGPRALQSGAALQQMLTNAAFGWSHDHWPCHATGNRANFRGLGSNTNTFVDNAARPLTAAMRRLLGEREEDEACRKRAWNDRAKGDPDALSLCLSDDEECE